MRETPFHQREVAPARISRGILPIRHCAGAVKADRTTLLAGVDPRREALVDYSRGINGRNE